MSYPQAGVIQSRVIGCTIVSHNDNNDNNDNDKTRTKHNPENTNEDDTEQLSLSSTCSSLISQPDDVVVEDDEGGTTNEAAVRPHDLATDTSSTTTWNNNNNLVETMVRAGPSIHHVHFKAMESRSTVLDPCHATRTQSSGWRRQHWFPAGRGTNRSPAVRGDAAYRAQVLSQSMGMATAMDHHHGTLYIVQVFRRPTPTNVLLVHDDDNES